MNFVVPALLSLVLGDFNADISAAQSIATRFSTQWVSWQNESPVSDYAAHKDRLNGNDLRPHFSTLNVGLKSNPSPAQVKAVQEFDATIAAALDAAVEYTKYLCDYDNEHGTKFQGVSVAGYYNILYPFFYTQVELIGSIAAETCDVFDGYEGGIGSLSSAFSYDIGEYITSYLCQQSLPASKYNPLSTVTEAASCAATSSVQSCVLRNAEGVVTATSSVAL